MLIFHKLAICLDQKINDPKQFIIKILPISVQKPSYVKKYSGRIHG